MLTLQQPDVVNAVAGGPRTGTGLASYDTSLVVSGGVDCGRRRRNVYDKKPQRYANDNKTAHLTARSDKSVAYVINNKRLYSTFCTVEAITTDRHEASRGLFATAELLVGLVLNVLKIALPQFSVNLLRFCNFIAYNAQA